MRIIPSLEGKKIKSLRPTVGVYRYSSTGPSFHHFYGEAIVDNCILVCKVYLNPYISFNESFTSGGVDLDMKDEETNHTMCLLSMED